jgi:hypothetical protein
MRTKREKVLEAYLGEENSEEIPGAQKKKGKPKGYWKVWENVEGVLKSLIQELGHFPIQNELKEHGYSSVVDALRKYHGGISSVRERMGFEVLKKPNRYWTLENTIEECRKLVIEHGNIPSQQRLRVMGLTSTAAAIAKYGGMHTFREMFGKKSTEKRKNFWRDEKNAVEAYRRVEQELGKPASDKDLQARGCSGLSDAINKHFGGITSFRNRAGLPQIRLEDYHWTPETILEEYKRIMQELGHNPTSGELKERYSVFFSAVDKFGGIRKIRNILKLENYQRPNGYWTKKRVLDQSRKLYEKLGYMPPQKELCRLGFSILPGFINKYFGGMIRLRKILGDKQIRVENGYWTEERILSQAGKVVKRLGYLPPYKKLCELGYAPLASQIGRMKHGFRYVRGKLGLEEDKRPAGYWQDKQNVIIEARRLYEELGYFPHIRDLKERKLTTLVGYAQEYFGGLRNLRRIVEAGRSELENVLEAYAGNRAGGEK